jgi:hypothetical protein
MSSTKRLASSPLGTTTEPKKSRIPSQSDGGWIIIKSKDTTSQDRKSKFEAIIETVSLVVKSRKESSQVQNTSSERPNFKKFVKKGKRPLSSQIKKMNAPRLEDFPMPKINKDDIQVSQIDEDEEDAEFL